MPQKFSLSSKKGREAIPDPHERAGEVRPSVSSDANAYAKTRDVGHRTDRRLQIFFVLCIVLVVVYLLGLVVPKNIFDEGLHHSLGYDGYSLAWFMDDLSTNINALVVTAAGGVPESGTYLYNIIGYILIAMSGACMALSGAVFQGTFRNALVTPSTLGVMSGATLGMAVWVMFFYDESLGQVVFNVAGGNAQSVAQASSDSLGVLEYISGSGGIAVCSFIGCCVVVGLVLLVVRVGTHGSTSGIMMIITGQVIGGIMGAFIGTMRYYYVTVDPDGEKAQMLMTLQMSSFYRGYGVIDLLTVGLPMLITFAVVMRYRDQLTLLSFSEGEARAMGVEPRRLRYAVVGLCTLLTAIVVSFCGHVGFVGFLVPHMARRLVGPHFKYLIPVSMVLGSVFVLSSYVLICMLLGTGYATMTGMFISILGAGVFLFTLVRGKGASLGRI